MNSSCCDEDDKKRLVVRRRVEGAQEVRHENRDPGWGAVGFEKVSILHSNFAGNRFSDEAAPGARELREVPTCAFVPGCGWRGATVLEARDRPRKSNFRLRVRDHRPGARQATSGCAAGTRRQRRQLIARAR